MKVCFVGIGSIAKRHIKNLMQISDERKTELQIDALRRKQNVEEEHTLAQITNFYYCAEDMPMDYDVIFLTNPTEYHIEMLKCLHNYAKHFFIEKPLTSFDRISEVQSLSCRDTSVYYIACPLRYTKVIEYLKNNVNRKEVICVRCICSSYLPDWHPGVDYRTGYSAQKELGGGVSIDLIHEWDYLKYLFGKPENVLYRLGKVSNLELNSEDYAVYIAEYEDMVLELHLDYFGRKPIRNLMIFTNEDTILADMIAGRISYMKEERVIDLYQDRDDYQKKELRHFWDMIEGREVCNNDVNTAYETLLLTRGII